MQIINKSLLFISTCYETVYILPPDGVSDVSVLKLLVTCLEISPIISSYGAIINFTPSGELWNFLKRYHLLLLHHMVQ